MAAERKYTVLISRPIEQHYGSEIYVELSANSEDFDDLPDEKIGVEKIAEGSIAFFPDNWTVSAYSKTGGWGEPQTIFG